MEAPVRASANSQVHPNVVKIAGEAPQAAAVSPISPNTAVKSSSIDVDVNSNFFFEDEMQALSSLHKVRVQLKGVTVTVPGAHESASDVNFLNSIPMSVREAVNPLPRETILENINLQLDPGTTTLILGPPGSGKSLLLKAIAGLLHTSPVSGPKVEGQVLFNGWEPSELASAESSGAPFNLRRTVGYIPQNDRHIPELSVQEMTEFVHSSTNVSGPADRSRMEAVLKCLGLDHVRKTTIGNELIRGVSGGERRRCTIAETLLSPFRVLCLDEITTGLDTAAAADISFMLRQWARKTGGVVAAALLQPPPDVVKSFDNVIVMDKDAVLFYGPVDLALKHFLDLGFQQPKYVDLADFLQDMATEVRSAYHVNGGNNCPDTKALAASWAASPLNLQHMASLQNTSKISASPEQQQSALNAKQYSSTFVTSWIRNFMLGCGLMLKLKTRDKEVLQARFGQAVMIGLVTGSLFWDMSYSNFNVRYGLMFFSMLLMSFGAFASLPQMFMTREVFYKQRDANMYPTSPFIMSMTAVDIPFSVVEVMVFSLIVYWMTGLTDNSGGAHFWLFYVVVLFLNISFSSVLRTLASWLPNLDVTQPICGFFVLLFVLTSGYISPRENLPTFYKGIYWINPIQWGITALANNEFLSTKYELQVTLPPGTPPGTTAPSFGQVYLDAFQFRTGMWNVGMSIAVSSICFAIMISLQILAFHRVRFNMGAITFNTQANASHSVGVNSMKSISFIPAALAFKGIKYTVPIPATKTEPASSRQLLQGINGYALPGTLTALCGSSGAGKTTLMDVVAGRKKMLKGYSMEGSILVNGQTLDAKSFAKISGYVEQDVALPPTSTVREALEFSARTRLPASVSQDQRHAFISDVMEILELNELADNRIGVVGGSGAGLSLEAGKRVSIGVELVANPSILFLDEPTSGLDSRGATVVMRVIKRVATTGRSVVCTIHQPSAVLFGMFDRLLLLQKGGKTVYMGDIGNLGQNLVNYFHAIPGAKKIEPMQNPATYMLEVIGAGVVRKQASQEVDFSAIWSASDLAAKEATLIESACSSEGKTHISSTIEDGISWTERFWMYLCYTFTVHWRSPEYSLARCFIAFGVGMFFGTIFISDSREKGTMAGIMSEVGSMYISMLFSCIVSAISCMPMIFRERNVFYKLQDRGMVSPLHFALSNSIVELPWSALFTFIFLVVFYPMVGFRGGFQYVAFYFLISYVNTYLSVSFGIMMAMATASMEAAQVVLPAFISIWNLFAGFMIVLPDIPDGWVWLYYLSPVAYTMESVCLDQLRCEGNCDTIPVINASTGLLVDKTPEKFLEDNFGWDVSHIWRNFGILIAMITLFRALSYAGIRFKRFGKN